MTFLPINDDHALDTIRFTLVFSQPIGAQALSAMKNNHNLWVDALPALAEDSVTLDTATGSITLPGLSFAFLQPDGTPTWSLKAAGFELNIVCNLYTRWDKVWPRCSEYMALALAIIGETQESINIVNAEMNVLDIFWDYNQDYDLIELLNKTEHIAPFIFDAGIAWHSKNGWFSGEQEERLLHNVDLESVPMGKDSTKVHITHFMRHGMNIHANSQTMTNNVIDSISGVFSEMHDQNKIMLENMLSTNIARRIKLKDSG